MPQDFDWTFAALWLQFGGAVVVLGRILGLLLAAWVAMKLVKRGIHNLQARISGRMDDPESVKRADTLGRVFGYLATVVVSVVVTMLVLAEVGVSLAPILGAAGVVGLAVGFGAQSLVKDYVTGFFLLLENQIRQGDVIQAGGHSGTVEQVTLRYVQLRDYDGNVHFVPNGTISSVTNMSRGFAHAVVDVGVGYGADLDQVMAVMRRVGAQMREDPANAGRILDDLDVAGVNELGDSAVVIRARFKVLAGTQAPVRRAFLLAVKKAFDAEGIEIPFPQMVLHRVPEPAAGQADAEAEISRLAPSGAAPPAAVGRPDAAR